MPGLPPQPELVIGGVYRDVDGSLVQLVAVANDICCWTPQGCASDSNQMSHRDNFVRRFVYVPPVSARPRRTRTKPARRVPGAVVIGLKAS